MKINKILLTTLFTAFPLILFATDYYIATSDLNVRTKAGARYSISFILLKGDEVEFLSKENDWYKIKHLGNVGYANSKYLKFSRATSYKNTNAPQKIVNNFLIGIYVCLALIFGFLIYRKIRDIKLLRSVTNTSRGTKSERDLVLKLLKFGISKQNVFHDLYVEKRNGEFSQTDLVALTEVGIIVFEVKDYSGWIFGSEDQSRWTQVLAYGKQKYSFYNPIMQNNRHVSELKKQLIQFENIPFYSVVVFYGNSVLKEIEFVSNGTFLVKAESALDALKIILKDNRPIQYTNRFEIDSVLKQAMANGGIRENQIKHRENIRIMLNKNRMFD